MSGHKRTLRMNAKLNRYDLRPWDVGKLPLYGSALTTVQAATLYCLYGSDFFGSNFKVQLPGQARGCSMRMAWITLPQPRRNKPWPSCPRQQVFLRVPSRPTTGPYQFTCVLWKSRDRLDKGCLAEQNGITSAVFPGEKCHRMVHSEHGRLRGRPFLQSAFPNYCACAGPERTPETIFLQE